MPQSSKILRRMFMPNRGKWTAEDVVNEAGLPITEHGLIQIVSGSKLPVFVRAAITFLIEEFDYDVEII